MVSLKRYYTDYSAFLLFYGNTRINAAPKLRRLFECGAYSGAALIRVKIKKCAKSHARHVKILKTKAVFITRSSLSALEILGNRSLHLKMTPTGTKFFKKISYLRVFETEINPPPIGREKFEDKRHTS